MQTLRDTLATSCATTRSKVSNGTRLLQNVDGRSSSARRFRDLVNAFEEEVGGPLSEVERGLIRQAAALTFKAEELQSALVNGEPVDGDQLIRLTGTAKRILSAISAKASKRKEPTPTLADHLRKRAERAAERPSGGEAA
jgi:hypothetical protein